MQPAISKLEAERAEVDDVLSSGVFGRTNNPVRLLTFVCEKYFEGAVDEIKEYSIAVHALGRPESFDPQVDTIVRVTAHALRKRLEDYYRSAGAEHAVHICLPPGHYVPKFIHARDLETAGGESTLEEKQNGQSLDRVSSSGNGRREDLHPAAQPPQASKADDVSGLYNAAGSGSKFRVRTGMVMLVAIFAFLSVYSRFLPGRNGMRELAARSP